MSEWYILFSITYILYVWQLICIMDSFFRQLLFYICDYLLFLWQFIYKLMSTITYFILLFMCITYCVCDNLCIWRILFLWQFLFIINYTFAATIFFMTCNFYLIFAATRLYTKLYFFGNFCWQFLFFNNLHINFRVITDLQTPYLLIRWCLRDIWSWSD